jgi:DNA polymerase V
MTATVHQFPEPKKPTRRKPRTPRKPRPEVEEIQTPEPAPPPRAARAEYGTVEVRDAINPNRLDLNRHLIRNPAQTFYVRVGGDSMKCAGIVAGSLLVVDRAIDAESGDIVVALVNGELCVRRMEVEGGRIRLTPDNEEYQPLGILEGMGLEIWGCVTHSIRTHKGVSN